MVRFWTESTIDTYKYHIELAGKYKSGHVSRWWYGEAKQVTRRNWRYKTIFCLPKNQPK